MALGDAPKAQVVYGLTTDGVAKLMESVAGVSDALGRKAVAQVSRVSLREVSAIARGEATPTRTTLAKLGRRYQR